MRAAESDGGAPPPVTIVVHDAAGAGGMERQVRELVERLLSRGGQVTLVARTNAVTPHERLEFVRVPGPARPFVLAYPWFLTLGSLIVALRRRGLLHTTGAIVLNYADVSTVHLCHARGGRNLRRERRATPPYRANRVISGLLSRVFEPLVYRRRTRRLVAVSELVRQELADAYPELPVDVIGNGVDTERFHPAGRDRGALNLDDDALVALFVGGEWHEKGLDVALEAIADATRWLLVVVGDGNTNRWRCRAAELGCENRVFFAGSTDVPERWYAAADAFLLPSMYETYSLAAFEAAASGLPIVATAVGELPALVVDGVTGWLVQRDGAAFASRLRQLEDAELREALGAAARTRAKHFRWSEVVDRYVDLYRELAHDTTRHSVKMT